VRQAFRLLLLGALLLFPILVGTPDDTRFWRALFNLGHAPLSGLLALVIRGYLASRARAAGRDAGRRASLAAFAVTLAVGAAIEVVQLAQAHRNPSWADLARDAAGAAGFLLLHEALAGRPQRAAAPRRAPWARRTIGLAGVALLAATTTSFAGTIRLYAERNRAVPTLFALDGSWWERELIDEDEARLTFPGGLARLDLEAAEYPGVTLEEPYPDWRGYTNLVLTIVSNLDSPLPMVLRVHDAAHNKRFGDRFNRRLVVRPGENTFRIPIDEIRRGPRGREMDMSRIRQILLFAFQLERPVHVYLGPIRLE
jgi:hypothetical protein